MLAHAYSAAICAGVTSAAGASHCTRAALRPSATSAPASPPAGSWLVSTRVRPLARPISGCTCATAAGSRFAQRLVEQEQLGVVQHRARDGEPLHHPARELGDGIVGAALHPDGLEHGLHARRASGTPCRRAW